VRCGRGFREADRAQQLARAPALGWAATPVRPQARPGRLLGRRRRYPRELGVAPASSVSLRSPTIWLDGRATPHPSPLAHPTPCDARSYFKVSTASSCCWLWLLGWAMGHQTDSSHLLASSTSIHEDKAHPMGRDREATRQHPALRTVLLTTRTKSPARLQWGGGLSFVVDRSH